MLTQMQMWPHTKQQKHKHNGRIEKPTTWENSLDSFNFIMNLKFL